MTTRAEPTKTPAKVRRARRAEAKKLTPAQREAAAKLLPASRKHMGAKIGHLKQEVKRVASIQPKTPREELEKRALLAEKAKQLAGAVGASKAQRVRRARGQAGIVRLSSEQAKAQKAAALQKLDLVRRQIKGLKPAATKPTSVRAPVNAATSALKKEEEVLVNRLKLLDEGKDLRRPLKVEPDKVPEQREPLKMPVVATEPEPVETVTIMRILASMVPRGPQESVELYQDRLREMTKRVLVRLARMSLVMGKDRSAAIQAAVEATLASDASVISKEFEATGGAAKDPAADAMDPYVDEVAADLEAAATDVSPPVPSKEPSPKELAELLRQADEEEQIAAAAPLEVSDEIAEDLLLADEPVPVDSSDLFSTRNLLIGGALLGGFLLLRSR